MGTGLSSITPAGLAAGAYQLTTVIINNGLADTALTVIKGIEGLPENIVNGLNSQDPKVRGETLVNALAIGSVATVVSAKLGAKIASNIKPVPLPDFNFSNAGKAAEGVVASRINIRTGDPQVTGSGLEYAWKKHGGDWGSNKSSFTISKDELTAILQDPLVVKTPAYLSHTSGNYIRTIEVGINIGIDAKSGGLPTSFMTIITDAKGNLVNTFPGKTF